jgi:hypothetical protein
MSCQQIERRFRCAGSSCEIHERFRSVQDGHALEGTTGDATAAISTAQGFKTKTIAST